MENILKVSSNIGAYKIGEKVGKDTYYRYISGFGFGEKTGIALPGEASGKLRSSKSLSPVGYANLSFGQGISVTALQLVNAISAVANGGHIMKPHVVKKIVDREGKTQLSNYPLRVRRVISDDTAKKISLMLERVVSSEGTGMRGALEKYRVAGKTGTSQKYDKKLKGYSKEKYTSSFIGFLPADNPKLSILVILDEPKKSYYGGTVAAPVFKKIAEQTLAYMKVTPVKEKDASSMLMQADVEVSQVSPVKRVLRTPAGGKLGTMPDLKGLTLREILVSMGSSPSKISGSGVVVQQFPLHGKLIKKGEPYRIKLGESRLKAGAVLL
jgi:cell division protein FtsI (penicillin-binding protein 3)